jgi:uncharacterized repeat protein (TIGR03847 family)
VTDAGQEWHLTDPQHFTCGAWGEPGRRVFYFQAIDGDTRVEVKCEKQQAVALAEHLVRLLGDLPEPADGPGEALPPTVALEPGEPAFVVGSISIGVDRARERIVAMFEELVIDPDDPEVLERSPAKLMVHLTREQVLGFAGQAELLASSSRPVCRLCELPMDPQGHVCPRLN